MDKQIAPEEGKDGIDRFTNNGYGITATPAITKEEAEAINKAVEERERRKTFVDDMADYNCGGLQPIEVLPEDEPEPDCAGLQPPEMLTKEQAEGFTFTPAEIEKFKAKEAAMTPEQRREASKALVEANTAANKALCKPKMQNDLTVSENLKKIMRDRNITQAELAKKMGVKQATLSSWMTGTRIPRMKNIDDLCSYLNVNRADLVGEQTNEIPYYYTSDVQEIAKEIYENPDWRMLFDIAKSAKDEDVRLVAEFLRRLKNKGR